MISDPAVIAVLDQAFLALWNAKKSYRLDPSTEAEVQAAYVAVRVLLDPIHTARRDDRAVIGTSESASP